MTVTRAERASHRLEERRSRVVTRRTVPVCPDCHSPVTAYGCAAACRGLDTD